jgi:hypothetical protein
MLPTTAFHVSKARARGFAAYCRECKASKQKAFRDRKLADRGPVVKVPRKRAARSQPQGVEPFYPLLPASRGPRASGWLKSLWLSRVVEADGETVNVDRVRKLLVNA